MPLQLNLQKNNFWSGLTEELSVTKKPDPINPINIPATCLLLTSNLKKNSPTKSVARGVNEFKIAVTPLSISV